MEILKHTFKYIAFSSTASCKLCEKWQVLRKIKGKLFIYLPYLLPPQQDCLKQFPTPGTKGLDLSWGGNGNRSNWTMHHVGVSFVNSRVLFLAHYNWHVLIQLGNKIELGGITSRSFVYYSYQLPAATPWEWGWRWEQTAQVARCTSINDRNSHVPWWRVCKVGCRWYVLTLLSISKFS